LDSGWSKKDNARKPVALLCPRLRDWAALNQNQIAVLLGFDRTGVHRAIKAMVREGLASETKAHSGKAILVELTSKGQKYRARLLKERRAADDKLRKEMTPEERATLLRN
jgi:DNA-binding MarR family transcriptional regulator